jgi:hypothetical protein
MQGIRLEMTSVSPDIPILGTADAYVGRLEPFSPSLLENDEILSLFSKWRNLNLKFFLNQEVSTLASTRNYVLGVLNDRRNHMYIMFTNTDHVAGHFGFKVVSSDVVELDNLLRTTEQINSSFVSWAEGALINHLFVNLGFSEIRLRMLSSNVLARRIHESFGFELVDVSPLTKRLTESGGVHFVAHHDPGEPDAFLFELGLKKEKFLTFVP